MELNELGLSFLARLNHFSGMNFASSFPAVGGDGGGAGDEGAGGGGAGGGGDEGGGEGGGEGAGEEDIEEIEDPDAEGGGEGDEEIDTEGEGDEEIEGEEVEGGAGKGKKLDVQKALDKLKKTDKVLAEVLRKEHFSNVDFKKAFASPTEAQAAADLLELVGGEEGVSTLQQKADDFAAELNMVAEGNPQILDDIVRDSPDGFKKLINAGLEKLRLLDQAFYERATAKPLANALREKGVVNTLEMIKQMAVAGKGQEVFDLCTKLLNWCGAVEDFASKAAAPQVTETDTAAKATLQKAEKIARQSYLREVGQSSNRVTSTVIKKHLDPLIRDAIKRGVKLSAEQRQDVAGGIYTEIAQSLKANTSYQRQMEAYYAKNADPDDIGNYVRSKVEQLAEAAAKKVWGRKGWASARGKVRTGGQGERGRERTGGGSGGGGTKAIFISKPPRPEIVDWSKDRSHTRHMGDGKTGEATLKSGKVVRWRW